MASNSREQEIIKLAQSTLTKTERWHINDQLIGAKGLDYIISILEQFNLSIGNKILKNVYFLVRDGEKIQNAVIKGDHERMQIIPIQGKT